MDYPGVVKGEPAGPGDFDIYVFNIYSKINLLDYNLVQCYIV